MPDEQNNQENPNASFIRDASDVLSRIKSQEILAKEASALIYSSALSAAKILTDLELKQKEAADTSTKILALNKQISDDQAVIATKSQHIQDAQVHADAVRANLDKQLTAATSQATEAEGLKTRTQSVADVSAKLLADIRASASSAEKDATSIATAKKDSETATLLTKTLASKAAHVEEVLSDYEKKLLDLQGRCAAQLKTIDDLLPGATTVGLAHAFDDRRKTFLKPHNHWQQLFVCSILALVALAGTGLYFAYKLDKVPTYDELFRLWIARLPIAAALVWLALHASRESALAKRLEEDYGYKATIASSFLGFHKQMVEIGEATAKNEPLAKLCSDTLKTIASPPGKIYSDHSLVVSPTDEVKQAAESAAAVLTAVKK